MKNIELLDRLRAKPVFRIQDVERLTGHSRQNAKQMIQRLKAKKLIKKVRRNAYTTKTDIHLIASNITYPSYISFWSASAFLGYTEQILKTVHVATRRRILPIQFEGYRIEFIPIKHFFGYRKIRTDEGELFISEDEKLAIDCLLRPEKAGNIDEIRNIFKKADLSAEKLVEYLKRVNKQAVTKRSGYLLEEAKGIDISKKFRLDRNYVSLDPFSEGIKSNAKWRVKT
ncbi:MAG: hypothetical protein JW778_00895 [Candidatus Altiarchaeota archaeon]|nr:hypothetical protein [Candidatus Altiarchaeota archaeon]